MKPRLFISELTPEVGILTDQLRENFLDLERFFRDEPFLNGEFRHYELVFTAAVSGYEFQHRLKFIPKDVVQTFVSNGVTVTWDYDAFDREIIKFTVSGACTLRFFVGRYSKETGVV